MPDNNTPAYKSAAVAFLRLVIAGRIEEAYQKHVAMNGKHHSPYFNAGFPALKQAMIENHTQSPNKQLTVKHVLGDGNLVAVHSHIIIRPGEAGQAAVHIFRFNDDRIVEIWDCVLPIPADSPNGDGAF
jgi:predicted SnoaL-like aldol condensation-catalyzing enzyme